MGYRKQRARSFWRIRWWISSNWNLRKAFKVIINHRWKIRNSKEKERTGVNRSYEQNQASSVKEIKKRNKKHSKKLWKSHYHFYIKVRRKSPINNRKEWRWLRGLYWRTKIKEEGHQYDCRSEKHVDGLQVCKMYSAFEQSIFEKICT